ncbi:hypothetical protein F5876DRAFT_74033 [Lentinula aff. lateritia]|uniref:Uncharacterized protein n=1 Tax=Lentinula aff. lateritia TaxID=2804960 RepID=A0ACC1U890_9AGAR|nr:hypothetical protein F5876DRAFT_74033 [Lentinula aff. lateritia]
MTRNRPTPTTTTTHSNPARLSAKARKLMYASVAAKTQSRKRNNITEFLDWAHQQHLHAKDILPASEITLCEYAAEFGGKLAGSSVKAKLSAIKGWTIMKGYAWQGSDCLRKVLASIERSAPPSSFRPEREPVKKSHLSTLHADLDLADTNSLDCCIAAAANLMFYSQLRAEEVLPTNSSITLYDFKAMPRVSDLSKANNAGSKRLFLPKTKTSQMRGDKVMVPVQQGSTNPIHSLDNHIHVNKLAPSDPLFAYVDTKGTKRILMKTLFLRRCNAIWKRHSISRRTGHCFRIGGTTHYLLVGVNPDVVQPEFFKELLIHPGLGVSHLWVVGRHLDAPQASFVWVVSSPASAPPGCVE